MKPFFSSIRTYLTDIRSLSMVTLNRPYYQSLMECHKGSILGPILFVIDIIVLSLKILGLDIKTYLFFGFLNVCQPKSRRGRGYHQKKCFHQNTWLVFCYVKILKYSVWIWALPLVEETNIQAQLISWFCYQLNLRRDKHIQNIGSKINKGIFLIRRWNHVSAEMFWEQSTLLKCIAIDLTEPFYGNPQSSAERLSEGYSD